MSSPIPGLPAGVQRVLLDEGQIRRRVETLAQEICADYGDECRLVLLAPLKGSVVFLADLMRQLARPITISFVLASSYGNSTESSGVPELQMDMCGDLSGADVLVVEDIIDTGRTLQRLVAAIRSRGAASVKVCCLLDKPARRVVELRPDYVGFEIADDFVVGYGLDFAEQHRNLPYVAVLDPDAAR